MFKIMNYEFRVVIFKMQVFSKQKKYLQLALAENVEIIGKVEKIIFYAQH